MSTMIYSEELWLISVVHSFSVISDHQIS